MSNSSELRDFGRLRLVSEAFGRTDNFLVIGLPTFAEIFIVITACCAGGLVANSPTDTATFRGIQSFSTSLDLDAGDIVLEAIAFTDSPGESFAEWAWAPRTSADHVFLVVLIGVERIPSVVTLDTNIR